MGKSIKLKSKILNKWTLTLSKPNSRTNSGLVDKLQLKKMPMPSKQFQALTFHARLTHAPLHGSLLFSSSLMKLKAHGQLLEALLRAKKEAKAKKERERKKRSQLLLCLLSCSKSNQSTIKLTLMILHRESTRMLPKRVFSGKLSTKRSQLLSVSSSLLSDSLLKTRRFQLMMLLRKLKH